jgi:hypothetical protein
MATSTYTITLIDNASAAANRVRTAMARVAVTTNATAAAFRMGGKAEQAFARDAEKLARVELRAAKAIMATGKALDKLNGVGRKSSAMFGKLGGAAQAVAGFIGTQLVGSTLGAARGFLEAAGLAEQFGDALLNLGKGDRTLSANWEAELLRLRIPLEQGRQDVIALLAAFKGVRNVNAGIATNDILKLGTALRLTAEQSKSFNKVFKDIGGKGKIQREELVGQLGDVGIGVTSTDFLEQVAKMQNITFAAAEKMLGKGQITAEMAIPALIEATKVARGITDLDAAAERASKGATGSLIALDNAVLKFKETVGRGLVEAGAVDLINKLADGILKFTTANPRLVTALAIGFGALALALGTLATVATGVFVVSTALGVLTGTLVPAAAAAWAFIAPLLIAAAPFIAVGAAAAFLGYQIAMLWKELGGWAVIWPAVKGFFVNLASAAVSLGAQALDWGRNIVSGLVEGITGGIGRAVDAVKNLGASVIGAGADILGIQSPSKVFAEQGRFIDEGLAMGIEDHQDLAFASAETMADGVVAEADMAAMTGSGVNQTAMANVGTAAGNALAATPGGPVGGSVGSVNVTINVDGAKDTQTTMQAIRSFFDTDFAALLERQLEGSGA